MSFALLAIALAAGQPAAAPGPPAKPDKICRQSQRQLDTRIRSGKTCKTAEQWEAEDARAAPALLIITEDQQDGPPGQAAAITTRGSTRSRTHGLAFF